jgi:hypothetical protein
VGRILQRRPIQKSIDLLAPRLGVGFSEVHQAPGVIRLEHDQAQGVRAFGLASAETASGKAKGARQPRLEVGCEAPEIFRRAKDEGFDRVQIGFGGAGDRTRGNGVEALDAQGILVEEVEEDGVDGAGGDPGHDREPKLGPVAGETAQHARLVGGAGAAATENEGEIIGC